MNILEELIKEIKIVRPTTAQVSQIFGQNKYSKLVNGVVKGYKELFGIDGHNGIDYMTRIGSIIIAPCDLEITSVYYVKDDPGYGTTMWAVSEKSVVIDNREYKLQFVFGHLKEFIEKKGKVKMGMTIAESGNTGEWSTGPHLHFGVRIVNRLVGAKTWNVINRNNGYGGYIDPKQFMFKSFQYEPLRFFKDYKTSTIYQLGVDGYMNIHSDAQLFQRLYGKFADIDIQQLKSRVPHSPERITIASFQKFKRIFKSYNN